MSSREPAGLQPAALAFVSYGFVLVRVRVPASRSCGAPEATPGGHWSRDVRTRRAARPRPQSDRPTSTPPPMHTTTPIHELYPTRESAVPTKYPRGGAPQKEGGQKPGSPAGAELPKHTHTGTLRYCACPAPPPFSFGLMRAESAHFNPQHWLLCHVGLC